MRDPPRAGGCSSALWMSRPGEIDDYHRKRSRQTPIPESITGWVRGQGVNTHLGPFDGLACASEATYRLDRKGTWHYCGYQTVLILRRCKRWEKWVGDNELVVLASSSIAFVKTSIVRIPAGSRLPGTPIRKSSCGQTLRLYGRCTSQIMFLVLNSRFSSSRNSV